MTFSIEREDDEFGKSTAYIPDEMHKWLREVRVIQDEGPLRVTVQMHDLNDQAFLQARKILVSKLEKMEGIKALLEPDTMHLSKKATENLENYNVLASSISFKAGEKSHIRSALNQADVPADIQLAVLSELQQIWQRTPG